MDYEKILKSLKICSETGTSCEGCSGKGERHCIANLTKAAAIAIETMLHTLDMAERERDVVTKRMIELEQEAGRLIAERDAAMAAVDHMAEYIVTLGKVDYWLCDDIPQELHLKHQPKNDGNYENGPCIECVKEYYLRGPRKEMALRGGDGR